MAYEVPQQWAHGDTPTAALMAKYSNGLNAVKATCDYAPMPNMAVPKYGGDPDDGEWRLIHFYRWLHTDDACKVINANDANQFENVPEPPSGTVLSFDLSTIAWLTPGMLYIVDGVAWACESPDF